MMTALAADYPFVVPRTTMKDSGNIRSKWLSENFGKVIFRHNPPGNERYIKINKLYMFKHEEDALLFKLTFG